MPDLIIDILSSGVAVAVAALFLRAFYRRAARTRMVPRDGTGDGMPDPVERGVTQSFFG